MSAPLRTRSGGWLHVEDVGSGPPILAIHGLGGGAWFFSGFAARLARDHRIIAVDLPGTGRSQAPHGASTDAAAISPDNWIADLAAFLADHVGEPAAILGHSMGTILALQLWRSHPQAVRSLIFTGGLPEALPGAKKRLTERMHTVLNGGMEGLAATAIAANLSPATIEHQPEIANLYGRLLELQDPAVYARCCAILVGLSATDVVSSVSVPCMSLSGRDDQYAPPEAVAAFMAELPQPPDNVVLADCGHLPFLEQPGRFADAVRAFLGANGPVLE